MFLPEVGIKTGKRAIVFFTIPEWRFAVHFLGLKSSLKYMGVSIKYNENGLVAGPVIGAPALALFLELLKKLEIKEVLALGWAGKFKGSTLKIEDLLLPEKAISFEGTSKFYYSNKKKVFFPDKELKKRLEKELELGGIPFKKGSILSVDAPIAFEKREELINRFEKKVDAMDMETSCLFAVSASLQIKTCVLHFIIDEVGRVFKNRQEKRIKELRKRLLKVWKGFLEYEF